MCYVHCACTVKLETTLTFILSGSPLTSVTFELSSDLPSGTISIYFNTHESSSILTNKITIRNTE